MNNSIIGDKFDRIFSIPFVAIALPIALVLFSLSSMVSIFINAIVSGYKEWN